MATVSSDQTRRSLSEAATALPWQDRQDFEDAERGLVARGGERVGTDAEDMAEEQHDPAFWAERREEIGRPPGQPADRFTDVSQSACRS